MNDRDFTKLLKKCAAASAKHNILTRLVHEECEARYGTTYSDIDADGIIDVLDYGNGGSINAREFHKHMKLRGADRIDNDNEVE